jgi:hypothetical protein
VIYPEGSWIWKAQQPIYEHGERNAVLVDGGRKRNMPPVVVIYNLAQGCKSQEESQNSRGTDEREEVAVVASSHAVVQPHAVVVERFHTIVANSAMVAPRRSPYIASLAILDRDIHGCGG